MNTIEKKALILLADGFELTEALCPYDVLIRSHKIQVDLASITDDLRVTSSSGNAVLANITLKEIYPSSYDFVILPGGKKGVENLSKSSLVNAILSSFENLGRPIYAICAAPSIMEKRGYYKGKRYTCFPGFEGRDKNYDEEAGVVNDHGTITGHSMGYSLDFAKAILEEQLGKEALESVLPGIYGIRSPAK